MTSTVIYEGELRTVATHLQSGSEIQTDAPLDNMGRGEKFSPTDLVATALGTCMSTVMGIKARDMDVDLKGMKIEVTKVMKADPRRIAEIDLTFHFPSTLQLNEKQMIVLEKTAHTCPVFYSLHPDIEIKVVFNWKPILV